MGGWWRSVDGGLRRVAVMVMMNSSRSSSSSMASYHTIQAIPREVVGSRAALKERKQGRVPTIVFSKGDSEDPNKPVSKKQLLTTEKKQLKSILESVEVPYFYSTVFPLQIRAGSGSSHLLESGNVLPLKVHRDPESGQILNLVLLWTDGVSDLKVNVPLVFKGEELSPGLKKGGCLRAIRTSLRYQCPVDLIPPKIEVDVSKLDIGDKVFMRDIKVNPSLKLLTKNENMPICKIIATKSEAPKPVVEDPEPVGEASEPVTV